MAKTRKNKQTDILLRHVQERRPRYSPFTSFLKIAMLPLALIADFACYFSASQRVFNEDSLTSLLVALTGTACLDIPMSVAGELISQPAGKNSAPAKRRRLQTGGLVAVFLLSYIVYILLLWPQFSAAEGMSTVALVGRLILPAITSLSCLWTSFNADPTADQAALLERQILELKAETGRVQAEVERGHQVLNAFDNERFDEEQLKLALRQCELASIEARHKLRVMLTEALPTEAAVHAFLVENQLADAIDSQEDFQRKAQANLDSYLPRPVAEDGSNATSENAVAFRAGA